MINKLFFWGFILCFFQGIAQENNSLSTLEQYKLSTKLKLNYIPVSMPKNIGNAEGIDMDLGGVHYLVSFSPHFYGGINTHAALFGNQGGLFTIGFELGYNQKLFSNIYLDANLDYGGGGGYRALINKGAYINPNIGLAYHFPQFNIGLQYSHFKFYTGSIKSNSLSVYVEIPTDIHVSKYQKSNQTYSDLNQPSAWNKPCGKGGFMLKFDQYFPFGGTKKDLVRNAEPLTNTLYLIGFEYQKYISENSFVFIHTDAIYKGLEAGYMDIFGGFGYEPLQTKYVDAFAKLALGASGGRIQAEGGATVYPAVGLDFKVSSHFTLSTHAGYVRALDGDFEAYALGAGLKYIGKTGGTYSKYHPNQKAKKVKTQGIRISAQHQTYFKLKRFERENRGPIDLHLLAIQLNYNLSPYFYIAGQTAFAYEATFLKDHERNKIGAGGYADGMVGLGIYSPIFAKEKLQLFAESFIGAGGGAGIDTGEGVIAKIKVGSYARINDYLSILISAGKVISPTTSLNSNNINLGLSVDFSTLTSTFK
ncbi:hypothetical protein AXE80_08710 [Wenyingzhuangia fucanilytica]|uniref:Uncharacterized protein n=1 Tax=Wenyingzhuangia fucanilytica TaxID=1790137 RepID=A0A1B1Y6G1_9FLAO|nr:hypothetical protein [Wenyingzhuangia fucanilytica]ANW96353.1 hypothetical protein AXE80_08710 [Wenyingzhuangia fucanilytica]